MWKLIVAYIRGWVAGKRGVSLWFCPYWFDVDTGLRSFQADVWMEGWSKATRRWKIKNLRNDQWPEMLKDQPF